MLYGCASSTLYGQANYTSLALGLMKQHHGTRFISEYPIVSVSLPSHPCSTTAAALGLESELEFRSWSSHVFLSNYNIADPFGSLRRTKS